MELNDPINCDGGAAAEPPADAAKDTPAIPNTEAVLFGRFALKIGFVCGTAEFLSAFASQKKMRDNRPIGSSFRSLLIAVTGKFIPQEANPHLRYRGSSRAHNRCPLMVNSESSALVRHGREAVL
ncbi:MAG: hypothetical protein ACLQL2_04200 [Methylovirgula sp.]